MIERAVSRVRVADIGGEIGKTAIDRARGLGDLIGVRQMDLTTLGNARRPQGQLPASNFGPLNGDRQAQARSDAAVVEEVVGIGLEVVGVEHPPAVRNGDSELMFFVAFSKQGKEPATVGAAKLLQRP